jgi:hypothetical protein
MPPQGIGAHHHGNPREFLSSATLIKLSRCEQFARESASILNIESAKAKAKSKDGPSPAT